MKIDRVSWVLLLAVHIVCVVLDNSGCGNAVCMAFSLLLSFPLMSAKSSLEPF